MNRSPRDLGSPCKSVQSGDGGSRTHARFPSSVGASWITEADPAKLLGVRRAGLGVSTYKRLLQDDPCAYCGSRRDGYRREVDHIHPRSKGGPDRWWNYTAACGFCNVLKFDDSLLEYLLRLRVDLPQFIEARMSARQTPRLSLRTLTHPKAGASHLTEEAP